LVEGLGLLLVQICRAHRNLVAGALDQLRVSVGQDHIVFRLAIEEGVTQATLAEALCVDASTVTKTLGRLERDGVVERRPDEVDGRVSRVFLTKRGRALVRPVVQIWTDTEDQLVSDLSDAERAVLLRLLRKVLISIT
jgi:MarR family transcriptional regulator, organic hydroperoxide resistance regulator